MVKACSIVVDSQEGETARGSKDQTSLEHFDVVDRRSGGADAWTGAMTGVCGRPAVGDHSMVYQADNLGSLSGLLSAAQTSRSFSSVEARAVDPSIGTKV